MRFSSIARLLLPLSLCLAAGVGAQPSAPTESAPIENPRQARRVVRVSDDANVLSESDKRRINAVCVTLEQRTDAEMAVATVPNLGGKSIKEYSNDLFRKLGIGKKGSDKGVLILNVVDERKVRIEVGYGLEGDLPDGKTAEIQRTQIAPFLVRAEFGAGLYAGALAVAQVVDPTFPAPTGASSTLPSTSQSPVDQATAPDNLDYPRRYPGNSYPSSYPSRGPSGGAIFGLMGLLVLLFPIIFIGGIVWFFTASMRRPLRCSKCRAPVQQLSDTAELPSLSPVQQFEQQIGARDYRVWRCIQCQNEDITAHDLPYSHFVQCPTCRHQTASTLVETLRDPTPWQGGMQRVILSCQWEGCKHSNFYNRPTAPMARGGTNRGYGVGGGDLLTGVILGSLLNGSGGGWNSGGGGSIGGDSGGFDSGGSDSGGLDGGFSDFGGGDSGGGGSDISY